jgi:hypothetical protein
MRLKLRNQSVFPHNIQITPFSQKTLCPCVFRRYFRLDREPQETNATQLDPIFQSPYN